MMLALQLCVTAPRPLLLAQHLRRTRRCRGGARTTSGVVRRTFALGASSFWRTWRPHAHHFSADSLFHGLPMCSVFRSKPKSHKHDTAFSGSRFFFFRSVLTSNRHQTTWFCPSAATQLRAGLRLPIGLTTIQPVPLETNPAPYSPASSEAQCCRARCIAVARVP